MPVLYIFVILLTAAIIAVPIARRLGFGSILGYLAAGLAIGPAGFGLITDVGNIAEASELGVVMLLFLIGLELRPVRLWTIRHAVLGLGSAQVTLTAAALTGIAHLAGLDWPAAVLVGFALSLSSTAIVLPMLAERDLLPSHAGRDGFSVLLFQDIAVIPAVALIPLLHSGMAVPGENAWLAVGRGALAILAILAGGRLLIRPLFRAVDSAKTPEIFTAAALLVVVGAAALANTAGLSMSLGAFMAGVLLSDSEFRHEIHADIQPFEGLLLGIFFISVGMRAHLDLLGQEPAFVLGAVVTLLAVKGTICFVLARIGGQSARDAMRFAFALPQAGEFGFVLFAMAVAYGVLSPAQSELFILVITLSMLAAPLLFWAEERWLQKLLTAPEPPAWDPIGVANPVVICGFGRVGQIVGRILRMRDIAFTALDKNAEQVATVRRFGTQAFYGDSTRPDLLRAAGAARARLMILALEDVGESLMVAETVRRHFPGLTILARARNRRHAHLLMDRGVQYIVRETFYSSLKIGELALGALGTMPSEASRTVELFAEHDEKLLVAQHDYYDDERQLIQTTQQITDELHRLLEADKAEATEPA